MLKFSPQQYENRETQSLWQILPDINLNDARGRENFFDILNALPIDQLYLPNQSGGETWFSRCIKKIDNTPTIAGLTQEQVAKWNHNCRVILANKLQNFIQSIQTTEEKALDILNRFRQSDNHALSKDQISYWLPWIVIWINEKWPFLPQQNQFDQSSQSLTFNTILDWPIEQSILLYSDTCSRELFVQSLGSYADLLRGITQFEAKFLPKMLEYINGNNCQEDVDQFLALLNDILQVKSLSNTDTSNAILKEIFATNADHKPKFFGANYFQMMEQHFDLFGMMYQKTLSNDEKKKFYIAYQQMTLTNQPSLTLLEKCLIHCSQEDNFDYLQIWAIRTMIQSGFDTMKQNGFNIQEFKINVLGKIYPHIHNNQMCIMLMLKTISECWENLSKVDQSTMLQGIANDANLRYFFEHCFVALPETKTFYRATAAKEFALFAELRRVSEHFKEELALLSAYKFQFPDGNTGQTFVSDESGVTILNAIPVTGWAKFKKTVRLDKVGVSLTEADARVKNKQNAQIYTRPEVGELVGKLGVVLPSAPSIENILNFEGEKNNVDPVHLKRQIYGNNEVVPASQVVTPTAPYLETVQNFQTIIPIAMAEVISVTNTNNITAIRESQIIPQSFQADRKMTSEEKEAEEQTSLNSTQYNGQPNPQSFLHYRLPDVPTERPVIYPNVPTNNFKKEQTERGYQIKVGG